MPKRFYHYLKPNANSETIHNAIFVDVETDDFERPDGVTEKRLRFGWAAFVKRNGRGQWCKPKWKRFTNHEEFWLWAVSLCHKKRRTWMWCHNSNFDYPALDALNWPEDSGWEVLNMVVEAPPTIIKYRMDSRTLILCDTLNIWRMSLTEMGEMVGLKKLKMPKEWKDDASDDAYCQRDVGIIMKGICDWCDFLKKEDMGGFVPTIAGQAMRTYRHKFMDYPILIDANQDALKLGRNCYKGGRCECGFIGHVREPVYSLDVNSMYPFVMATQEFPSKLLRFTEFISVRGLSDLLRNYCICAKVRLNTDEPFTWVLRDGKLCFPVGDFDAYLTTPELSYALERGYIRNIYIAAIYERRPLFHRFALDLYEHKEQASRDGRLIDKEHWKLVLNSFYGKWGQNGKHWHRINWRPHPTDDVAAYFNWQTREKTYFRYWGRHVFSRTDEAESRESHPAIAAHITGHARMILWAMIREIMPENYLYCDTDGILTTKAGFDKLYHRIDDHRLGGLKHIGTFDDCRIYGAKDYVLNGERTLKGIRYDAEKLNETTFQQIHWYGLAGLARAGSLNMPLTRMVTKTLRRDYTKGIVGADGFVTPFHLGDS